MSADGALYAGWKGVLLRALPARARETALVPLLFGSLSLAFGWLGYVLTNASGGRLAWDGKPMRSSARTKNLFLACSSRSALLPPAERRAAAVSSALVALVAMTLSAACVRWGARAVLLWYGAPWLVVHSWLILYTFLHHIHPDVPHYGAAEFERSVAQLATVDRPYPALVGWLHHHIGTYHVVHHLDAAIPHYYLKKATAVARRTLGAMYRYDPTSIGAAAAQAWAQCVYVKGDSGRQMWCGSLSE